ncbi:MAG: DUF4279 domain-containing protein [Planctomycetota bacterium]
MPKPVYSVAWASVRFMAPNLDPLVVTKATRLPADTQHRRGEPHIRRSRKSGNVREYSPFHAGLWVMTSESWVESLSLETHIIWLLDQLEPKAQSIHAIRVNDLEIDFFCCSIGNTPSPPPISRETTGRAEALGIRIEIDHYDSSDDRH